jgi:hypothetical protein
MNNNRKLFGAVLAGVGTWLITRYVQNVKTHRQRVTKKVAKDAVQSWEGEGGAIPEAAPRVGAG